MTARHPDDVAMSPLTSAERIDFVYMITTLFPGCERRTWDIAFRLRRMVDEEER